MPSDSLVHVSSNSRQALLKSEVRIDMPRRQAPQRIYPKLL
jgi:hypothetical protein